MYESSFLVVFRFRLKLNGEVLGKRLTCWAQRLDGWTPSPVLLRCDQQRRGRRRRRARWQRRGRWRRRKGWRGKSRWRLGGPPLNQQHIPPPHTSAWRTVVRFYTSLFNANGQCKQCIILHIYEVHQTKGIFLFSTVGERKFPVVHN